jgi:hypothetical protein
VGKNLDPLHLLLAALLAGGIFYSPHPSTPEPTSIGAPQSVANSPPITQLTPDTPVPDGVIDAAAMLARHLNVDVSTDGLERYARSAVRVLAQPPASGHISGGEQGEAAAYLKALLSLDIVKTAAGRDAARVAIERIVNANEPASADVATVRRFLGAYFDPLPLTLTGASYEAQVVAADFGRIDKQRLMTTRRMIILPCAHCSRQCLIRSIRSPAGHSIRRWRRCSRPSTRAITFSTSSTFLTGIRPKGPTPRVAAGRNSTNGTPG